MAKNALDQIDDILEEFEGTVAKELKEATESVMKDGVKKLKSTSPTRTGKYSRSWKSKMEGESGAIQVVHGTIYAEKPHYRLTHLLEHGHAKKGGGRVPAYPHIADVNDWAQDEVVKRLREAIE